MSMTKIWATLFMEALWQFPQPTANQANQTPIFCVNLGFCGRHNLPFAVSGQKFCPESVHHLVVWTSLAADQILLWIKYLQSLSHKIANCLIFCPFPPSLYQRPFRRFLVTKNKILKIIVDANSAEMVCVWNISKECTMMLGAWCWRWAIVAEMSWQEDSGGTQSAFPLCTTV